jgi:predicted small metal-binding protein
LTCDCGFVAQADTEDLMVANAQTHARDVHGVEIPAGRLLDLAEQQRAADLP